MHRMASGAIKTTGRLHQVLRARPGGVARLEGLGVRHHPAEAHLKMAKRTSRSRACKVAKIVMQVILSIHSDRRPGGGRPAREQSTNVCKQREHGAASGWQTRGTKANGAYQAPNAGKKGMQNDIQI